jgi:hypothetical protein
VDECSYGWNVRVVPTPDQVGRATPPKRTIQLSQASVAKGATMDDQRDYAEERANLLLMHEECEGCETCQPSADLPKWDEAGYNYLLHFELPN